MAFIPLNNTVQLLLQGTHLTSKVENTFYFKVQAGTPVTQADLVALIASWSSNTLASVAQLYTNKTVFTQVTARDMSTEAGLQVTEPLIFPVAGTQNDATMPGNSSLGLRRKSALAGRTHHGRIMLMPFPKIQVVDDIAQPNQAGRIAVLAANLLTAIARPSGGVFRPSTASFKEQASQAIVAWVFDTIMDSMKTRLTGHGN